MTALRIFMYLICTISIGWSVLVFGGPPILKKLILEYSDGAVTPNGISVSPRLDISISQLEFNFQNKTAWRQLGGFSRATKVKWSLFGGKPFIEISLGPSVLKDFATADSAKFYTPSFQKIDWQNIALVAHVDSVVVNSFSKIQSITFGGNINIESSKISNVDFLAKEFSANYGNSTYSASLIKSNLGELSLNSNLARKLFSSTFTIEDIMISEPNFATPHAIMEISTAENSSNFKIDFQDVKLSEFGGYIPNLKVDGSFAQSNVLQELQIVSAGGFLSKKLPKFQEIFARVKRLGHENYKVSITGTLEEFELSDSDNFIGLMPAGNFVLDSQIDGAAQKVTSTSKINFITFSSSEIFGHIEMGFSLEQARNLECVFLDCELADLNLSYKINFNDEWVKGSAYCLKSFCDLSEMEYVLRTSNTVNIFTILNKENILSPLSSLYLFSAISSGQKINGGHELSFQF